MLNVIKEKLSTTYHSTVSISAIGCHLDTYRYKNVLPKSTTHMLTAHDKK
jgi:hypothetical protein